MNGASRKTKVTMNLIIALTIFCVSTNMCFAQLLSSFSRLKESPRKPDIREFLPMLKYLQKPKESERNIVRLLKQLGASYNSQFTSILEPKELKARDPSVIEAKENDEHVMRSHPNMNDELKHMKFFVRKSSGKKKQYGKRLSNKLQLWLWNLSKCPVRYRWIDLGENIFPRFIKRGSCTKKKTCSFPAGMKCEKSKWKTISVLIYTCLKEFNTVSSTNCKWRPMSLEVLTECSCGCNK